MYLTEICECGKLKQRNRSCKTCGFLSSADPAELAAAEELKIPVAKALPAEDDMERARR